MHNAEPTCICFEGYYPDATSGLNCILGKPGSSNNQQLENRPLADHEMQEFTDIARAMGNDSLKTGYIAFKQKSPSESYAAHLMDRHKRKRLGDVWIIIGSSVVLAGGVALSVWAFQNIGADAFSNTSMGIMVPAFAVFVYMCAFIGDLLGAAGMISGIIQLHENTRAIHKLKPVADRYSRTKKMTQKNVQFSGIAPIGTPQHLFPGVSFRFSFI